MKHFILILVVITLLGCQKNKPADLTLGTWSICFRDGKYREYQITNNYMLWLEKDFNYISKRKIVRNSTNQTGIISELTQDTLFIVPISKNRLALVDLVFKTNLTLNRIENAITAIDSTNLENWKSQTLLDFQKRAHQTNCPDLRTEEEKIIYEIGMSNFEDEEEEDIPMIKIEEDDEENVAN